MDEEMMSYARHTALHQVPRMQGIETVKDVQYYMRIYEKTMYKHI
jgi:hypothetical protein